MAEGLIFDVKMALPGFALEAKGQVPPTGITALTGPSGSGKTTILRALAGLAPGVTGRVQFGGTDWSGLETHHRRIGFVFQEPRLFPHLSVAQNLQFGATRRGVSAARIDQIAALLGLEDLLHRRPTTLSGGEARRASLARALASDPQILFLDEPLTGLDRPRRDKVLAMIADIVHELGLPALYVTHDSAEIAAVADRVIEVANGRVTGWAPAPQRLIAMLNGPVRDGRLHLRLGNLPLSFPMPQGSVPQDRIWTIPIQPGHYLLTGNDPGESSAAAVLPARCVGISDGVASLQIEDQTLHLPLSGACPARPGQAAYLSLTTPWALPRRNVDEAPDLKKDE